MDGVWRTINGVHVLIGKDGTILKGPKALQKSDIQKRLKKQLNKTELKPKWCEVSENFSPEVRERIINQINELNEKYPKAFEQDHKLRITHTMDMDEKEFAYLTDNGIMFINSRYINNLDNFSKVYQDSVKSGWNQKIPKGKELEGIVTHEFGHYYQNMQYETSDLSDSMSKTAYAIKIQDEIHEDYVSKNGVKDINISSYGLSSPREWYAEMFLQYHFYPDNEYAKNFYEKAIKGGK